MADTPTEGETAPTTVKNDGTTTSAPTSNASDALVEQLKKEKEQAEMRANQLQNELKAKAKAEEEAQQKALEEQSEFKNLFEQEKAKNEAFQREAEEAEARIELEKSQGEILKEFPAEVVELAQETGMGLTENTEEAKEKLRSTLTKLSEKVSAAAKVAPNNQGAAQPSGKTREELLQEYAKTGSEAVITEAISELNWVKGSKALDGVE